MFALERELLLNLEPVQNSMFGSATIITGVHDDIPRNNQNIPPTGVRHAIVRFP